jgi:hypothetical protein
MSSNGISSQIFSTSSGSGDLVSAPPPAPFTLENPKIEIGPRKRNSFDLNHLNNENNQSNKKEKLFNDKQTKNKKMLLLDFLEDKKENLSLVFKTIKENSNINPISLKRLEKGGISVLFRNETAKNTVSKLLYEKLDGQLRPKSFMEVKKTFEVCCQLPKEIDVQSFCTAIGAIKYISRLGKEYIFFLNSKIEAGNLVRDGFIYEDYLIVFEPFTFAPHICCLRCGSKDHKLCENEVLETLCNYCTGNHSFKNCDMFKLDRKAAKLSKKKTYAEALGSSDSLSKVMVMNTHAKGTPVAALNQEEKSTGFPIDFTEMNTVEKLNYILKQRKEEENS